MLNYLMKGIGGITVLLVLGFAPVNNKINTSAQTAEWQLEKDKNDIKVYTRQATGLKIKEFMAVTTVTAKMQSLETLIDNVSDYTDWQSNVEIAKVLKQVSQNLRFIYFTTDVPWPVSDRDIVIQSEKSLSEKGTLTYTLTSAPDYIKEKEDFLRIRDAKGKWQFIPQAGGKIKVLYCFYGDPSGSIPNWLINMFIVDGPFKSLTNLKEIVES